MGKPKRSDSQQVDRTSSTTSAIPASTDLDMIWNETLSQSEPSIQSRPNTFVNRLPPPICHSSSYKVSIGHETVNITEILPPRPTIDRLPTIISNERRRILGQRQGASVLSLCFMCFVSSSLILIAISMMHLFIRIEMNNEKQFLPIYFPSTHNNSSNFFYMFSSSTMAESILGNHHRILRDLAMVICLAIVVLNCFCLLVFSIEIYLGSNLTKVKINSFRWNSLFSSSTARFVAICSFYASIPALILVMCLFILLSMTFLLAILSLIILGLSLIFILMTLLTYFVNWRTNYRSSTDEKSSMFHSTIYQPIVMSNHLDDDFDLVRVDELSTLV